MNFKIVVASAPECDQIDDNLEKYNELALPILQENKFESFSYAAKDSNGKLIGGCVAYSSYYYIGYVDTLWVDEEYRNQGVGSKLMDQVEKSLKDYGCSLCHLDTFSFQAPGFYEKRGYKIFGTLEHKKAGISEYFLVKDLSGETNG